jgi:phosphohistidine swiveling domain-containing protein
VSPLRLADLTIADAPRAGRKAAALGEMLRAGLPVPDGFVALVDDADSSIAASTTGLEGPFAVRSSGVAEDTADASFAGQYETLLDVSAGDVAAAVKRVRASGSAARVATYAGAEMAPIPVLVQRLIRADVAGVAFTADPVSGERDVAIVSAVRGLGESLVSGQANADEWVVRKGAASRRRDGPQAIDAASATRVAELARRVERHFGAPQDIEWAISAGKLYLLQARPMTALPDEVSWDVPSGAWVRNFRLGEWLGHPITPLFESWAVERIEPRLRPHQTGRLHTIVNGWYFYSMDWFPQVPDEAALDLEEQAAGGGISAFIIRPDPEHYAHDLREWREQLSPAYHNAVTRSERRIATASLDELTRIVDQLVGHAAEHFGSICIVGGNAWKLELDLAEFYRTHLQPRIGGTHLDLLRGLRVPTLEAHAVESLDWYFPTAGEVGLIVDDDARERGARLGMQRVAAERKARASLSGDETLRADFEELLRGAQEAAPVREAQVAELTLGWPTLRHALLRIGELLVARGDLAEREEVFFLRRDELERTADRRAVLRERHLAWQRSSRLTPPLVVGTLPKYWEAYYRNVAEALRSPTGENGTFRGGAASPGRATGPVRVIRSATEFAKLRSGDVLVCQATTPAWTALFGRAAAVVTDTGSAASHSSIVAREFGIPAVVGTVDATARLRDGQRVTVDGSAGIVIVHTT